MNEVWEQAQVEGGIGSMRVVSVAGEVPIQSSSDRPLYITDTGNTYAANGNTTWVVTVNWSELF